MSDIKIISRLINGFQRNIDVSTNTLVVGNIKIGGDTNYAIFNVSAVSGAKTITMPNTNVDLGQIATNASNVSTAQADATQALADAATADAKAVIADGKAVTADGKAVAAQDDIDAHVALSNNPHSVTKAQVLASELIVNADVKSDAAIAESKLALAHSTTDLYTAIQNAQAGINMKDPVRAASVEALTLSGLQTIDGIALTAGQRVLVKDQASAIDNGIYAVASGAWIRATDFDGDPSGEVAGGNLIYTEFGTENAATLFIVKGQTGINVGTESIEFTVFSRVENIDAGTGILRSGTTLSIDFTEFDTDNVVEGTTNLYSTNARVIASILTGYVSAAGTVASSDSILQAIQKLNGNIEAAKTNVDNLVTLSGVAVDSIDLGTFTGTIIADNSKIKQALQSLETAVEAAGDASLFTKAMIAGEAFSANTVYAVRMAKAGETNSRIYKAGLAEADCNVIGLIYPTSAISASDSVNVIMLGEISSSVAFTASQDEGKIVYLAASGAISLSYTSVVDEAVVKVGVVSNVGAAGTAKIMVQGIQIFGIN